MTQNRRPVGIIVVCAILGVFTLFSIPTLFLGLLGPLYMLYNLVNVALSILCIYGLWMMKKWSVILYTILFLIETGISLIMGGFSFWIIIPIALLVVMYMNYNLMD